MTPNQKSLAQFLLDKHQRQLQQDPSAAAALVDHKVREDPLTAALGYRSIDPPAFVRDVNGEIGVDTQGILKWVDDQGDIDATTLAFLTTGLSSEQMFQQSALSMAITARAEGDNPVVLPERMAQSAPPLFELTRLHDPHLKSVMEWERFQDLFSQKRAYVYPLTKYALWRCAHLSEQESILDVPAHVVDNIVDGILHVMPSRNKIGLDHNDSPDTYEYLPELFEQYNRPQAVFSYPLNRLLKNWVTQGDGHNHRLTAELGMLIWRWLISNPSTWGQYVSTAEPYHRELLLADRATYLAYIALTHELLLTYPFLDLLFDDNGVHDQIQMEHDLWEEAFVNSWEWVHSTYDGQASKAVYEFQKTLPPFSNLIHDLIVNPNDLIEAQVDVRKLADNDELCRFINCAFVPSTMALNPSVTPTYNLYGRTYKGAFNHRLMNLADQNQLQVDSGRRPGGSNRSAFPNHSLYAQDEETYYPTHDPYHHIQVTMASVSLPPVRRVILQWYGEQPLTPVYTAPPPPLQESPMITTHLTLEQLAGRENIHQLNLAGYPIPASINNDTQLGLPDLSVRIWNSYNGQWKSASQYITRHGDDFIISDDIVTDFMDLDQIQLPTTVANIQEVNAVHRKMAWQERIIYRWRYPEAEALIAGVRIQATERIYGRLYTPVQLPGINLPVAVHCAPDGALLFIDERGMLVSEHACANLKRAKVTETDDHRLEMHDLTEDALFTITGDQVVGRTTYRWTKDGSSPWRVVNLYLNTGAVLQYVHDPKGALNHPRFYDACSQVGAAMHSAVGRHFMQSQNRITAQEVAKLVTSRVPVRLKVTDDYAQASQDQNQPPAQNFTQGQNMNPFDHFQTQAPTNMGAAHGYTPAQIPGQHMFQRPAQDNYRGPYGNTAAPTAAVSEPAHVRRTYAASRIIAPDGSLVDYTNDAILRDALAYQQQSARVGTYFRVLVDGMPTGVLLAGIDTAAIQTTGRKIMMVYMVDPNMENHPSAQAQQYQLPVLEVPAFLLPNIAPNAVRPAQQPQGSSRSAFVQPSPPQVDKAYQGPYTVEATANFTHTRANQAQAGQGYHQSHQTHGHGAANEVILGKEIPVQPIAAPGNYAQGESRKIAAVNTLTKVGYTLPELLSDTFVDEGVQLMFKGTMHEENIHFIKQYNAAKERRKTLKVPQPVVRSEPPAARASSPLAPHAQMVKFDITPPAPAIQKPIGPRPVAVQPAIVVNKVRKFAAKWKNYAANTPFNDAKLPMIEAADPMSTNHVLGQDESEDYVQSIEPKSEVEKKDAAQMYPMHAMVDTNSVIDEELTLDTLNEAQLPTGYLYPIEGLPDVEIKTMFVRGQPDEEGYAIIDASNDDDLDEDQLSDDGFVKDVKIQIQLSESSKTSPVLSVQEAAFYTNAEMSIINTTVTTTAIEVTQATRAKSFLFLKPLVTVNGNEYIEEIEKRINDGSMTTVKHVCEYLCSMRLKLQAFAKSRVGSISVQGSMTRDQKSYVASLEALMLINQHLTDVVNDVLKTHFGVRETIESYMIEAAEMVKHLDAYGEEVSVGWDSLEFEIVKEFVKCRVSAQDQAVINESILGDSGLYIDNHLYIGEPAIMVKLRAPLTHLGLQLDKDGYARAVPLNTKSGSHGNALTAALIGQLEQFTNVEELDHEFRRPLHYRNIFVVTMENKILRFVKRAGVTMANQKDRWMVSLAG
jgi:hypothetical protein